MVSVNDLDHRQLHEMCKARVEPYDMLPKPVREYIQVSPFGAHTSLLWDLVGLHYKGESPEKIIRHIKAREDRAREIAAAAAEYESKQAEYREASRRRDISRRYG